MAANDRKRAMRNGQYWVFKKKPLLAKLLWIIIDGTEIQGTLARRIGSAAHD